MENPNKTHSVVHARIDLAVDFTTKSLGGFVEYLVVPRCRSLSSIRFSCKNIKNQVEPHNTNQITIRKVLLNGREAENVNLLPNLLPAEAISEISQGKFSPEQFKDLDNYIELLDNCLDEALFGELEIKIPDDIANSIVEFEKLSNKNSLKNSKQNVPKFYTPILIRIEYEIVNPIVGFQFVLPRENCPNRSVFGFTSTSIGNVSTWLPCDEYSSEKITFELNVTCRSKYTVIGAGDIVGSSLEKENPQLKTFSFRSDVPVTIRSIGFVVGEFNSYNDKHVDFVSHFMIKNSCDFTYDSISYDSKHYASEEKKRNKIAKVALLNTVKCVNPIFEVYSNMIKYKWKHYKFVFVDDAYCDCISFLGMSIIGMHLIHDKTIIDQAFATQQKIAHSVALSWISPVLPLNEVKDAWIVWGVSGYMVSKFLEHQFGRNESDFQRLDDIESLVTADRQYRSIKDKSSNEDDQESVHEIAGNSPKKRMKLTPELKQGMITLSSPVKAATSPKIMKTPDSELTLKISKKNIKSVTKDSKKKINYQPNMQQLNKHRKKRLNGMLKKRTRRAGTGSLHHNLHHHAHALSHSERIPTLASPPLYYNGYLNPFTALSPLNTQVAIKAYVVMKMLENIVSEDILIRIFDNLCDGSEDIPRLEIDFKQKLGGFDDDNEKKTLKKRKIMITRFNRSLTGKLQKILQDSCSKDVDLGNFFSYWVLGIGYPDTRCLVKFGAKKRSVDLYFTQEEKKIKFFGKMKVRIFETNGASEVDIEKIEEKYSFDLKSRLDRNRTRKNIKDKESADLDDLLKRESESPVLYVRIDPNLVWFSPVQVEQHEVMWCYQLKEDFDVISQAIAIQALRLLPNRSLIGRRTLCYCIEEPKYFWKIRVAAVYSILDCWQLMIDDKKNQKVEEMVKKNQEKVIEYFNKQYWNSNLKCYESNDFSSFSDYFVKVAIPSALSSTIVDSKTGTSKEIIEFVLTLLEMNDNSKNPYSDVYYLSSLLRCIGNFKSPPLDYRERFYKVLFHWLELDESLPSFHSSITQACLESLVMLDLYYWDKVEELNYKKKSSSFPNEDTKDDGMETLDLDQPSLSLENGTSDSGKANHESEEQMLLEIKLNDKNIKNSNTSRMDVDEEKNISSKFHSKYPMLSLEYQKYCSPKYFRGLRVTAFKCLLMLMSKDINLIEDIFDIVNKEPVIGVQIEMMDVWWKMFSTPGLTLGLDEIKHGDLGFSEKSGFLATLSPSGGLHHSNLISHSTPQTVWKNFSPRSQSLNSHKLSNEGFGLHGFEDPLDAFRLNTPFNTKIRERLWNMLINCPDLLLSQCIMKIYESIWGTKGSSIANETEKESIHFGNGPNHERRKLADELFNLRQKSRIIKDDELGPINVSKKGGTYKLKEKDSGTRTFGKIV